MYEELLAAGWTCEAKKSFRRENGRVFEADFYWSPTRKGPTVPRGWDTLWDTTNYYSIYYLRML